MKPTRRESCRNMGGQQEVDRSGGGRPRLACTSGVTGQREAYVLRSCESRVCRFLPVFGSGRLGVNCGMERKGFCRWRKA